MVFAPREPSFFGSPIAVTPAISVVKTSGTTSILMSRTNASPNGLNQVFAIVLDRALAAAWAATPTETDAPSLTQALQRRKLFGILCLKIVVQFGKADLSVVVHVQRNNIDRTA